MNAPSGLRKLWIEAPEHFVASGPLGFLPGSMFLLSHVLSDALLGELGAIVALQASADEAR